MTAPEYHAGFSSPRKKRGPENPCLLARQPTHTAYAGKRLTYKVAINPLSTYICSANSAHTMVQFWQSSDSSIWPQGVLCSPRKGRPRWPWLYRAWVFAWAASLPDQLTGRRVCSTSHTLGVSVHAQVQACPCMQACRPVNECAFVCTHVYMCTGVHTCVSMQADARNEEQKEQHLTCIFSPSSYPSYFLGLLSLHKYSTNPPPLNAKVQNSKGSENHKCVGISSGNKASLSALPRKGTTDTH